MAKAVAKKNDAALWQRILVPTDFSRPADAALVYGLRLAQLSGATLHVCHVVPVPHVLDALYERGFEPPESFKRILGKARRHIKTVIDTSPGGRQVTVRMHFSEGDAISGALEWATKLSADLIVMGTHGRTGAKRFFMGSVAEGLVRRAPCPVLTMRGDSGDGI
jgi:nucleotide-binding universal stress UspA family protein